MAFRPRSSVILVMLALGTMATEEPAPSWLRHCEKDTPTPVEGIVEGEVPSWLEGRLTRVGPGLIYVGNMSYNHLFDPLALLHSVTIREGRATYLSQYLHSDAYTKNTEAQRIVARGFGTASIPDPCRSLFDRVASWFNPQPPEPVDNCLVNILQVRDQLISMTETNEARVVDPETLNTLGDKIVISDYVAVQRATAHPHVSPDGIAYNLASSLQNGPSYSIISIPNGQIEKAKIEATVPAQWRFHPGYMHSFAITENYFVLLETPLTVSVTGLVRSRLLGKSIEESMEWFPEEKVQFRVIDRRTGIEHQTTFVSDTFFTFHQINAFETDNGMLVVDTCAISSGKVIKSLYFANLRKESLDPTKQKYDSIAKRFVLPVGDIAQMPENIELLESIPEAKLHDSTGNSASAKKIDDQTIHLQGLTLHQSFFEMPRINYAYNGKPYRYAYGVGTEMMSMDFSSLIKLDVKTGETKEWKDPAYVVSEPVFVPSPTSKSTGLEDDGVILSVLLHRAEAKKISFLVLNAQDFSQIAKVEFDIEGTATQTFHGQFVSAFDEIHGY